MKFRSLKFILTMMFFIYINEWIFIYKLFIIFSIITFLIGMFFFLLNPNLQKTQENSFFLIVFSFWKNFPAFYSSI